MQMSLSAEDAWQKEYRWPIDADAFKPYCKQDPTAKQAAGDYECGRSKVVHAIIIIIMLRHPNNHSKGTH